MSNRYQQRFARLKKLNQKAFMPFTMLGWPDREGCLSTITTMLNCGATHLELGLAFSDPVADGPVIQEAARQTIDSGFRVKDAFELIRSVRKRDLEIPIGLLTYYNLVLRHGVDTFFKQASEVGVDGVLIVDLPPESATEISPYANACDIQPIFLVSPLTRPQRLQKILENAQGFLYVVSRLGITGVDDRYDLDLKSLIADLKGATELPLCVGFGISSPDQALHMFSLGADGVIVGSKIIELIRHTPRRLLDSSLTEYLRGMVSATQGCVRSTTTPEL